ncbi:adenylate/guanylate cyclase domain-containing protein [Flammeovirgaceae bacterium SG7u.111]|nr:adenylate/guanylate cyclase domain-containing protein [Flammeovirgaceae bacterium SG7u.132]WPO36506.1 adenylate/guanylate cyclase domain-containing protein [Flammeovirgaceae bacterium SG7u.111]
MKIMLREMVFIVLAWIGFMNLYAAIVMGFFPFFDFTSLPMEGIHEKVTSYATSIPGRLEPTFFGFFFGVWFSITNFLTEETRIRKKSFGFIVLIKTLLYCLSIVLSGLLIRMIYLLFNAYPFELKALDINHFNYEVIGTVMFVYIFLCILFTNFVLQVDKNLGHGNLLKMIMGKYHSPRDEQRIFMFLDLKGSTTIAEQMGHNMYSQLIQHCFQDLTDVVIAHKAQIYQYVGDEVVLTWTLKDGLENMNCIRLYFAYEKKLASRSKYYQKKFNMLPQFKAGIEMGAVTVAEVGEIKREIAYHGDVLNTAARIQERCNEFGRKVLFSENIEKKLVEDYKINSTFIGDLQLKGKQQKVKIYATEDPDVFSLVAKD